MRNRSSPDYLYRRFFFFFLFDGPPHPKKSEIQSIDCRSRFVHPCVKDLVTWPLSLSAPGDASRQTSVGQTPLACACISLHANSTSASSVSRLHTTNRMTSWDRTVAVTRYIWPLFIKRSYSFFVQTSSPCTPKTTITYQHPRRSTYNNLVMFRRDFGKPK